MSINMASMNVRGLNDDLKQNRFFSHIIKSSINIMFAQEIYANEVTKLKWCKKWGRKAWIAEYTSQSRGVGIFISHKTNFQELSYKYDKQGRWQILYGLLDDVCTTLVNIYAPNVDNPEFFEKLIREVEHLNCENVIMAGDFNFVLDRQVDCINRKMNNDKARQKIDVK